MSRTRQKLLVTIGVFLAPLALVVGPASSTHAAESEAQAGTWKTVRPGVRPADIGPGANLNTRNGIDGLASNAPTGCRGSNQAGTVALRTYLRHWFPAGKAGGIYVCRDIDGGGYSLHAEGRAYDHMLSVKVPEQKKQGDAIFYAFTKKDKNAVPAGLARRWGVQEIIWNCQIWTAARANEGVRRYSKCDTSSSPTLRHEDHVHIGQNDAGAAGRTTAYTGYQVYVPDAV